MTRRKLTHPTLIRRLSGDTAGVTLVEFAFVGPVLILMVMGIFDMAHTQYSSSMVNGALQKAARDLTLENAGSQRDTVDARVREQIMTVVPKDTIVTFERLSHFDFTDVNEPEPFTDENGDGICNFNEVYEDTNENKRWDKNRGREGIGGARDVVLYTANVTYPRLFPMFGLAGLSQNVTIRASTVLRNQPFDLQDRTSLTGNCP